MFTNPIIQRLKSEGIDDALFAGAQILLMPENILHAGQGDELVETTDMDAFSKALREAGGQVFTFMDAGIDLPAIDRRSGDKWLGTVWIRDHAAIPIIISVISGMIVLAVDRATTPDSSPPKPIPNVHIDILVEEPDGRRAKVKYVGDGKTLIGVLEALKNDDGSKD